MKGTAGIRVSNKCKAGIYRMDFCYSLSSTGGGKTNLEENTPQ